MAGFLDKLLKFAEKLAGESKKDAGKTKKLDDAAEKAASPVKELADSMRQCARAVNQLVSQLGNIHPEAQPAGGPNGIGGAPGGLANVEKMIGGMKSSPGISKIEGIIGGIGTGGEAAAGLGAGGAVAAAAAPIAAFGMAVMGSIEIFNKVTDTLRPWVEALSPGTIQQFDRSIKDLQATLGHAFQPFFERAIDFFENLAGMIYPLMEKLRPIIDELVGEGFSNLETTLGVLVDILDMTFEVVKPLIDSFRVLEAEVAGTMEVMGGLWKVVRAGFDTLNAVVGSSDVSETVKKVRDQFHELTKAMVVFIAQITKFFGATGFIDNLIKAFEPKTGEKAAGPVTTKSLESIAKEMAEASMMAAGGTGEKQKGPEDIVAALKEVKSGQNDGTNKLLEVLKQISEYLQKIKNAKQEFDRGVETTTGFASGVAGLIPGLGMARRTLGL